MLTEEWRVFKDVLSRPEQAFASELHDTRNKWAHNEPFRPEDTYRALDSMERLLTATGAVEPAEELRNFGSALDVLGQRATYLNADGARYCSTPQSPSTEPQDHADRLREHPEEVWAELCRRLGAERTARGTSPRSTPAPAAAATCRTPREAKLVIVHPQTHTAAGTTTRRRCASLLRALTPADRPNAASRDRARDLPDLTDEVRLARYEAAGGAAGDEHGDRAESHVRDDAGGNHNPGRAAGQA